MGRLAESIGGGAGGAGGSQGPSAGGHRGGSEFDMLRTRFAQMSKKAFVVLAVVILIVAAFCYWWFHPPINIHSVDLWMFLAIFVLFPSFLVFFIFHQIYERGMGKREKNEKKSKRFKGLMVVPVIIALVGVLGAVASLTLFPGNAEKYSTILNTEDGDFATDIEQADYSTIPFIDRDSAVLLGNRTMGTMADYVSQFEISDLYSQINYRDAPVRVSPLNYADVFKWWSNLCWFTREIYPFIAHSQCRSKHCWASLAHSAILKSPREFRNKNSALVATFLRLGIVAISPIADCCPKTRRKWLCRGLLPRCQGGGELPIAKKLQKSRDFCFWTLGAAST